MRGDAGAVFPHETASFYFLLIFSGSVGDLTALLSALTSTLPCMGDMVMGREINWLWFYFSEYFVAVLFSVYIDGM